jgi:hypothetical protein
LELTYAPDGERELIIYCEGNPDGAYSYITDVEYDGINTYTFTFRNDIDTIDEDISLVVI